MISYLKILTISSALTVILIAHIFQQKKQFYPAVVHITQSRFILGLVYLQGFVVAHIFAQVVQCIFFGELRAAENERLTERAWYALSETCLAFTVFREDFSPSFVFMFAVLLLVKAFHWLTEERVELMERSPNIPFKFHIRTASATFILGAVDMSFLRAAYNSLMTSGPTVQLVFGFEYALLLISLIYIVIKYTLHLDTILELNLDNKTVIFVYVDIVMNMFKVCLYIMFTCLMFKARTLPLFAVRPLYSTLKFLQKTVKLLIQSRRALHHLNNLYPSVPEAELNNSDVCIICREELRPESKKLPCGHIFHTSCLRSWFQRQQTCPTCRFDILNPPAETQPTVTASVETPSNLDPERVKVLSLQEQLRAAESETINNIKDLMTCLKQLNQVIVSTTNLMEQYCATLSNEGNEGNPEPSASTSTQATETTNNEAQHIRENRLKKFIQT